MNASYRRSQQLAQERRSRMTGRGFRSSPWQQLLSARAAGIKGLGNATGIPVTEQTALQLAAVFCAVRTISQTKASLPVDVFERRGTGLRDEKVHLHPVAQILAREPNPDQTPFTFHEQRQAHLLLWGNAYATLSFTPAGDLLDATVQHPNLVQPFRDENTKDKRGRPRLRYEVEGFDSQRQNVDRSDIIHTPGLSFDGLTGISVVKAAAQSFGIALASDRLAASFYANAAKPSMVVTTPEYLDDDAFRRLQRELNEEYTAEMSFRALLLEGGATAAFATMPFRDAQFLESRRFQGEEIASRWFGLPAHLAGYLENASYNTLTEQDRAYVVHTLTPWLIRDEQEWNRKAFRREERGRFYVKYNVDGLLRGDTKSRYEAHRNALFAGWSTVNEVREIEDRPPVQGGDELPRPAAIWGKIEPGKAQPPVSKDPGPDVTAEDAQSAEDERGERSTDDRLRRLVTHTVTSMMHAERVQAARHAGSATFAARMLDFYQSHRGKLEARLQALGGDLTAIEGYVARHEADLLHASHDADPAAAVALCIEGWRNDPARLADELLNC